MLPWNKAMKKMLHLNFQDFGLFGAVSEEPWDQKENSVKLWNALAKLEQHFPGEEVFDGAVALTSLELCTTWALCSVWHSKKGPEDTRLSKANANLAALHV